MLRWFYENNYQQRALSAGKQGKFCSGNNYHSRWIDPAICRNAHGYQAGQNETGSNKLYISNSATDTLIYGEFDNDFVTINGKLGIGTTECYDAKLAVDGTIMAKEIIVTVADFPDYVFDDSYRLMSLADLESYIKSNKHLPGIKTRKEVLKNGVPLGELNIQLLEKIEELTLHLIDLDKRATRISKDGEILLANTKTY